MLNYQRVSPMNIPIQHSFLWFNPADRRPIFFSSFGQRGSCTSDDLANFMQFMSPGNKIREIRTGSRTKIDRFHGILLGVHRPLQHDQLANGPETNEVQELEKNMGTHDDSWFLAASVDLYFPKFKGNNRNNASSLKSKHGNTETKRSTPPAKKAQKWMFFFALDALDLLKIVLRCSFVCLTLW